MNLLKKLQSKFASEIIRYGITRVEIIDREVKITFTERIPWELYESIKIEVL